jgi:hypothetical protein
LPVVHLRRAAAARGGGCGAASGWRHGLKKPCRTDGNPILHISPQGLIWIKPSALDGDADDADQ